MYKDLFIILGFLPESWEILHIFSIGKGAHNGPPNQPRKIPGSLKFRIEVEEELYYLSSENKGADQLRGYREPDLRLCFRLCRLLVFPWGGSNIKVLQKREENN